MAVIGSATLNIVPKVVGGLGRAIDDEIAGANLAGAGEKAGSGFMSGFKNSASFGLWSDVASKAIDTVSNSLGNAASRVDTLNNYPRIMEQLGVSTDESNSSIKTMSDALSNVPTRLDDMASTTTGLYAATKKYGTSLTTATDAGLALNSMLLAGGQSTGIVNAAMEQFRQMVAKGKPELQDWRSMIQAAPGQMEQLAEAMLGAGKTADDLYAALGGGQKGQAGKDFVPDIPMDEFVEKFAQMKDRFAKSAEEAQGGIQTAFSNMQNAVTKGVANVIQAIGQENMAKAIDVVKSLINDAFGFIGDVADKIGPAVGGIIDSVKGVVDGVHKMRDSLSDDLKYGFFDGLDSDKGKIADLNDAISKISGLNEGAGSGFSSLADSIEWAMSRAKDSAQAAKDAHEDYISQVTKSADAIRDAYASFEGDSRRLDSAAEAIEKYGNKAGITAGQQWELKRALEEVNDMCGTHYGTLENGYTIIDTETGKVQNNTQAIKDNIETRRYAAKAEAIGTALNEEEKVYDAAAAYYAEQKRANDDAIKAMDLLVEKYGSVEEVAKRAKEALGRSQTGDMTGEEQQIVNVYNAWKTASDTMADATNKMHDAENAVSSLSSQSSALEQLAQGGEQSFHDLAAASGVAAEAIGTDGGMALENFASTLQQLGDSAEIDGERLRAALSNPEQMAEIVAAYDGTAQSLQGVFDTMGLGWDQTAAKAADASNGVALFKDSFNGVEESAQAMQAVGGNADELAAKLSNAGITSQDLANMGIDNFTRLAQACHGNVDDMVSSIQWYNETPIIDKDGKVVVDDQRLVDSLGNVYTFNKEGKPEDKDGKVVVDDKELRDAHGNVVTWNGTNLEPKSTHVTTDDGGLPGLIDHANTFISLPDNTYKYARYETDIVTNHQDNFWEHHGENAAGGHIEPRHAGGFIATGPTRTPFGLVGENGVETVIRNDDGSMDVYPLNNPRYLGYARPLAEAIAAHVTKAMGSTGTVVNVALNYDAGADANQMAYDVADRLALALGARGM